MIMAVGVGSVYWRLETRLPVIYSIRLEMTKAYVRGLINGITMGY